MIAPALHTGHDVRQLLVEAFLLKRNGPLDLRDIATRPAPPTPREACATAGRRSVADRPPGSSDTSAIRMSLAVQIGPDTATSSSLVLGDVHMDVPAGHGYAAMFHRRPDRAWCVPKTADASREPLFGNDDNSSVPLLTGQSR
jgi:hypothetical protein